MKTKCMEFLAKSGDFSILDVGFLLHLFLSVMELINVLEQYGFSPREAKVYLAVLELGIAPASSIARRLDENRVTVYSVLKSLKKKGIVYETQKGGTSYYGVIEPEKLLEQQKEKIRKLEEKMPEFIALANVGGVKPKIQFFEGEEGLVQQYHDMLSSTDDIIRSFFTVKHFKTKTYKRLINDFLPKRIKLGIPVRVIMQGDNDDYEYIHTSDEGLLKEVLIIDKDFFNLECQIDIYANKKVSIVISSESELTGVIIESGRVYTTLKNIFELIWQGHS